MVRVPRVRAVAGPVDVESESSGRALVYGATFTYVIIKKRKAPVLRHSAKSIPTNLRWLSIGSWLLGCLLVAFLAKDRVVGRAPEDVHDLRESVGVFLLGVDVERLHERVRLFSRARRLLGRRARARR